MSFEHRSSVATPPSRVVVLGGTGFIGQSLVRRLEREGIPVVSIGTRDVDLTGDDAAARLGRCLRDGDALVFAAAVTREKGRDAETCVNNVAMARSVIRALRQSSCSHVVYISSDAVYADAAPNPVSEATSCDPGCLYGLMHLVRERLLASALADCDVPLAILRPSIIYGPGDTHGSYGPNRFRRTVAAAREIALFGDGEEQRDHLFVDDFVTVVAMTLWRRSHGVLNVATGMSRTFSEIADRVAALSGATVRIVSLPRAVPVTHRSYDVRRLLLAFPDFSPTSFDVALARTFEDVLGSAASRA